MHEKNIFVIYFENVNCMALILLAFLVTVGLFS